MTSGRGQLGSPLVSIILLAVSSLSTACSRAAHARHTAGIHDRHMQGKARPFQLNIKEIKTNIDNINYEIILWRTRAGDLQVLN